MNGDYLRGRLQQVDLSGEFSDSVFELLFVSDHSLEREIFFGDKFLEFLCSKGLILQTFLDELDFYLPLCHSAFVLRFEQSFLIPV